MGAKLRMMVVLGGAILLIAGTISAVRMRRLVAGATQEMGTVVRLNAGGSHPEVAFRTVDGTIVSYPQGGMIVGCHVGQAVQVLYDHADPSGSARAHSFGSLWGDSVALAVCGAGLLAFGLASFAGPVVFHFRGR